MMQVPTGDDYEMNEFPVQFTDGTTLQINLTVNATVEDGDGVVECIYEDRRHVVPWTRNACQMCSKSSNANYITNVPNVAMRATLREFGFNPRKAFLCEGCTCISQRIDIDHPSYMNVRYVPDYLYDLSDNPIVPVTRMSHVITTSNRLTCIGMICDRTNNIRVINRIKKLLVEHGDHEYETWIMRGDPKTREAEESP